MSDLYVTVGKLRAYKDCPYRAKFEDRPYESTIKQKRGELFHNAIEQYILRRWTVANGVDFIRQRWPCATDEPEEAARELCDQFVAAFEWSVESRWIDLDRYVATEQTFRMCRMLPNGLHYVIGGRVDAIRRHPAELIDWKMTEYLETDIERYRADVATPIYAAYAESVVGCEGIKVSYVRPLLRERTPVASFWLEHEDIIAGMQRIDSLAARYFGEDHPRQANRWCSSCSFSATCPQAEEHAASERAETQRLALLIRTPEQSAGPRNEVSLEAVQRIARSVAALRRELEYRGYLQELLGYECVDAGVVHGVAGSETNLYFFLNSGVGETWPSAVEIEEYSWDQLRAFLEFLAPRVSAGVEKNGDYHSFDACGWHYKSFDYRPAFKYLHRSVNQLFKVCEVPYAFNEIGRIVSYDDLDQDCRKIVLQFFDAYVDRVTPAVWTSEAAIEAAEESEWVLNPMDSLALLRTRGFPENFSDARRQMLPGTLSIQRQAAALVSLELDPEPVRF